LEKVFGDEVSSVYMAGKTAVNILASSQAEELLSPANATTTNQGVQAVYTLRVSDVDAVTSELQTRGVILLNGPIDCPQVSPTLDSPQSMRHKCARRI
jgi:hypothetical protein